MTDSDQLRRALVQNLESLRRSGVQSIPRPEFVPNVPVANSVAPAVPTPVKPAPAVRPASKPAPVTQAAKPASGDMLIREQTGFSGNAMAADDRGPALQVLSQEVAQCELCPELAAKRTQTVFGVGNPNARLVFFGEAPGADEDRQGEPFVGKAGQLLTKIIEACQLTRDDVYILNVLKCRPPNNRNPTPEEATCCRPFFEKQLEIIRPEIICCLGSIAATTLLETTMPVGRLRGKFHNWRGISVAVTYHPAYLLRIQPRKNYVGGYENGDERIGSCFVMQLRLDAEFSDALLDGDKNVRWPQISNAPTSSWGGSRQINLRISCSYARTTRDVANSHMSGPKYGLEHLDSTKSAATPAEQKSPPATNEPSQH